MDVWSGWMMAGMEEAVTIETAGITGMEEMADMIGMAIMTIIRGSKNDVKKHHYNSGRITWA
ncbi:MAG: hypothetical protein WCA04_02555 [Geobacteraceae bacterium]